MAKLHSTRLPETEPRTDGPPRVRLWGDFEGPYLVEDTQEDGRLVIVPDQVALEEIECLKAAGGWRPSFEAIYIGMKPIPWEDPG
jgi:hypothetical protein